MVVVDVGQINYRSELPRRILDGVKAFGQMLPDVLQAAHVQRLEAVIYHVLVRRVRVGPSTARDLCGNQIYGAFVLSRRVDLHAIDATLARWRGDVGSSPLDGASTAASSQ